LVWLFLFPFRPFLFLPLPFLFFSPFLFIDEVRTPVKMTDSGCVQCQNDKFGVRVEVSWSEDELGYTEEGEEGGGYGGWIRISIVGDDGKVVHLASNIHLVTRCPYHLNTLLAKAYGT
jgi:hypothetical protein